MQNVYFGNMGVKDPDIPIMKSLLMSKSMTNFRQFHEYL